MRKARASLCALRRQFEGPSVSIPFRRLLRCKNDGPTCLWCHVKVGGGISTKQPQQNAIPRIAWYKGNARKNTIAPGSARCIHIYRQKVKIRMQRHPRTYIYAVSDNKNTAPPTPSKLTLLLLVVNCARPRPQKKNTQTDELRTLPAHRQDSV